MFEIITAIIIITLVISLWLAFRHTKSNPIDNKQELDEEAINLQNAFEQLKQNKNVE